MPAGNAWTSAEHLNGDVRTIYNSSTCRRGHRPAQSAWEPTPIPRGRFRTGATNRRRSTCPMFRNWSTSEGTLSTPQNVPFARFGEDRNIAFTSLWDNWPRSVTMPIDQSAEAVWLLICGSTNPMQSRIANAEVLFRYADGQVEKLELVPPLNFWSLSSWGGLDYSYDTDAFALPPQPPPTVQLGRECRAMVLSWKLRPGVKLDVDHARSTQPGGGRGPDGREPDEPAVGAPSGSADLPDALQRSTVEPPAPAGLLPKVTAPSCPGG